MSLPGRKMPSAASSSGVLAAVSSSVVPVERKLHQQWEVAPALVPPLVSCVVDYKRRVNILSLIKKIYIVRFRNFH
jgi:hypothetical protein